MLQEMRPPRQLFTAFPLFSAQNDLGLDCVPLKPVMRIDVMDRNLMAG